MFCGQNCVLETIIKEIEKAVLKRIESLNQDDSDKYALFDIFCGPSFRSEEIMPKMVNRVAFRSRKDVDWDIDWRSVADSFGEIQVWNSGNSILYTLFVKYIHECSYYGKTGIEDIVFLECFASRKKLIETLTEKLQLVVLKKDSLIFNVDQMWKEFLLILVRRISICKVKTQKMLHETRF